MSTPDAQEFPQGGVPAAPGHAAPARAERAKAAQRRLMFGGLSILGGIAVIVGVPVLMHFVVGDATNLTQQGALSTLIAIGVGVILAIKGVIDIIRGLIGLARLPKA